MGVIGRRGNRLAAGIVGIGLVGVSALALGLGAGAEGGGARHASAALHDTSGNHVGWAKLTEDGTGRVHVNVKVDGLTPGLHGIHIHAVGSCTPPFASAGGHHNPSATTHGAHAGDLPNLEVNRAGRGRLNSATTAATLSPGPASVFDTDGSAIIVHADPDDLVTDPAGNSGPRIACGVIVGG